MRIMVNESEPDPQNERSDRIKNQIAAGSLIFDETSREHRMEGYAAQSGRYFSVPMVTHVEDNLYQGGCADGLPLPDGFKHVISLYPWEQYALPEDCDRDEIVMYDSVDQTFEELERVADLVIKKLQEGPTLVHCQAGLNRSGLVAARVLMKLGRTSDEAISLLREQRSSEVLCNPAFETHLRSLDA